MGLAAAAARRYHNVRPVVRLYDRAGPLVGARVKMSADPYFALHQGKALILQGRNREGKTTLLSTALPWYHRRPVVVLERRTRQCGQQLPRLSHGPALRLHENPVHHQHHHQHLHGEAAPAGLATHLGSADRPEAVLRHCGQFREASEAISGRGVELGELLDQHSGSRQGESSCVVNSHAGAQTLLNLNQGPRFTKLIMEPQ